jgi:NADPH:quinone reductase-like Zn-dependent oxidoreductase
MGRRSDLNDALRHVASGALKPVLDSVVPLAEARAAHERIESRAHFGKLVLVP